jgi:hypothetical protein
MQFDVNIYNRLVLKIKINPMWIWNTIEILKN